MLLLVGLFAISANFETTVTSSAGGSNGAILLRRCNLDCPILFLSGKEIFVHGAVVNFSQSGSGVAERVEKENGGAGQIRARPCPGNAASQLIFRWRGQSAPS